ncbi:type II secretion system F family protein [Microbacterium sp. MC2]
MTATALILGGAFAAGLLLIAHRIPRWAAPTLSRRIAPYVRDVADPRGVTPLAGPVTWAGWRRTGNRIAAILGADEALTRRLQRAGHRPDPVAFRARQLGWALAGALVGAVAVVAVTLVGQGSPVMVLLPPLLAAVGAVGYDLRLTSAVRRRTARIAEELPTVLEFLALCLAAGEGLRDALRRVGEVGSGELTREVRRAVLATGTGSSLADALGDLARRLDVPALSRATDQLTAAIERGAPLAQVLQAQAADVREDAKRDLIEQAGKKEIAMLLPLVFLILPLSVVFAVFPGVVMLRLGIG